MEQALIPVKEKMLKAIDLLQEDLSTIRTGRATPALIENVEVSAYDGTQNLKIREMATITTDGPRVIIISPFDPSVIQDIEKGINGANLGFNAIVDGNIVRISLPSLTQERREEYIKLMGQKIEAGRVMVRQIRHDMMSTLKKEFEAKNLNEDDKKRLEKHLQELTDEMMDEIEKIRKKKEKELSEV